MTIRILQERLVPRDAAHRPPPMPAPRGRSRLRTGVRLCSVLVLIYSASLLVPLAVAMGFAEPQALSFLRAFVIAAGIGGSGLLLSRGAVQPLRTRDGFLLVVAFWLIFSVCSALPFAVDALVPMRIVDATFEAVSGITTTGATVLGGLDAQPRSIVFYRAQLNFLGGLGIIVLAIALLPLLGIGGAKLYQSETPGPLKEERMTPRLADTAKGLWAIYASMAAVCAIAYRLAGMDWFDAICHSLATVSLGGFSTHDASLGFYDSAAIEIVGGVFSILAAVNFALYFRAYRSRSLGPWLDDPEFRFFVRIAAVVVLVTIATLYLSGTFAAREALYHGFFQAISVMTDNGLGTVGYPNWPAAIVMLLIVSSFIGGCVGSTCGGIKVLRVMLLLRESEREIRQILHPQAIVSVRLGRRAIPGPALQAVGTFFMLFVASACFFTLALCFTGMDPLSAFGTTAACLNNMGIGYGTTAAGFGGLGDGAKWIMVVAMLCGRLEVLPVLIVCSRSFWRD